MPYKYKLLADHRLVFGVFYGVLTPEEYLGGVNELSHNPAFEPNYDRLGFCHKTLDLSLFHVNSIMAIKDRMIEAYYGGVAPDASEAPSYRIAVVSERSINETMLKLYGATLAAAMQTDISVRTFLGLDDALGWLDRDALLEELRKPEWIEFLTIES